MHPKIDLSVLEHTTSVSRQEHFIPLRGFTPLSKHHAVLSCPLPLIVNQSQWQHNYWVGLLFSFLWTIYRHQCPMIPLLVMLYLLAHTSEVDNTITIPWQCYYTTVILQNVCHFACMGLAGDLSGWFIFCKAIRQYLFSVYRLKV